MRVLITILMMVLGGYSGRVYPGVSLGGVDLGNITYDQAKKVIEIRLRQAQPINLVWGTSKWRVGRNDLGIRYSFQETAQAVMQAGSDFKTKIRIANEGMTIDPVIEMDEAMFNQGIASIAAQINVPEREPEIRIEKGGSVSVSTGENGQEVDERELKQRVLKAAKRLGQEDVQIPIIAIRPKLSDEEVEKVKTRAQNLVGKRMRITDGEGNSWEITDEQLVTWVDPAGWKRLKIEDWVEELASSIDRPPQNAYFRFVQSGRVEEFKPAKWGVAVKQKETTERIIAALNRMEETVVLAEDKTKPAIDTAEVNELGIKELLAKGESWFSGSITNRIFNLKKAAETMNGILVPPGETFSFNQNLGEVSAATGFKQAYIIKEGKTILGDGGGVCQVSTTLFRAVLAAGLPIEARTAHAYRVHYYEEKYQVGFDATVFQPAPDFKFKNDTAAHILIQTRFDEKNKHLVFELYGTGDGRKAVISKARVWEVTQPPPDLYVDDPTLPVGRIVQTEHKANGAKVAFDWKVTRGEEVLQERTFYSNYRSWQAVFLRGTKTN